MFVRQAVVLVGGKGTRLGDLTRTIPKPLLEVAPGVRFLDAPLLEMARHGFTDIVLLAGHLGDQVEQAYNGKRVFDARIRVIREPEPQGTGGALCFVGESLDPWFVMSNGDSLFDINLRELTRGIDASLDGRLALREVADPARYGAVSVNGEAITAFHEKNVTLKGPALINGGIYLLNRNVRGLVTGPCSIEADIFPELVRRRRLQGRHFDGYFLDIGLPDTYEQAQLEIPQRMRRPCAFLDRDGVLNHDAGYTHKPESLRWIDGAPEAIRMLNEAGYFVVVVTNQAGIARGYYSERDMQRFHEHMSAELSDHGAHIDAFYHCPFHPDGVVEQYRAANHPDRKPNPGLIQRAMKDWPIEREHSFLIGDQDHDLAAAKAAGLPAAKFEGGDLATLVRQIIAGS